MGHGENGRGMQAPVTDKYTYDAKVVNVVDGDTIRCHADLGFGITYDTQNLRLARINTPELKGESREAALAAKEALKNLIGDKTVLIRTLKNRRDRYGRYMCEVWVKECETEEESWVNVSDWLVAHGYAEKYV